MGVIQDIQEGVSVDACIDEANEEFMQDLEHHMQWLKKQKPEACVAFADNLRAALNSYGDAVPA